MALIILTTTGGATVTMPGDFSAPGSSVALFGSGGNGGTGTSGTSGTAGGGGGGGACTVLVYSSGTFNPGTNVPYLCNAGGSANATQWQSATAGSGAYYEALPGGNGAASGTAGAASGATTTVGTPTITFTPTNHTGAAGGAGGGANTIGAGGGGGSGGPAANGGTGGTPTSTGGGGGGGGGAANAGGSPSTATGGTGGNGSTGAGGTGSGTSGTSGNPGTGSSGGGGGPGAATVNVAGNGGSGGDISNDTNARIGCGGGGGGTGSKITTGAATTLTGGNGGLYGGGGGGVGCQRTAGGTLTPGSGAQGAIGIAYRSTAWNFVGVQETFHPRQGSQLIAKRSGVKQRTGFVVFPFWRNRFEEVFSQEPRQRWERRGAFLRGDDGILGVATSLPQPSTPPFGYDPPWITHRRTPRTEGTLDDGDPGTEAGLFPFFPAGWEPNLPTPITPYALSWRYQRAASGMRGDDGIVFPQINFFPAGWEQVFAQPVHRFWKSPDVGDQGVQSPFIQFVPTSWPYEQTWKHYPFQRSGAIAQGDQGNQFPLQSFFPSGWEFNQPTTLHRLFKSPEFGDQGTQFPFINFFPVGWDQVFTQPVHKFFKSPDIGDSGIEAPFIFVSPVAVTWGFDFQQQPWRRPYRSPEFGDQGIVFPQINFFPSGWEQIFAQPVHKFFKSPDTGDAGIQSPFIQFIPTAWPHEQTYKIWKKPHSALRGRSEFMIFPAWYNWGWEQTATQPLHRLFKSPDTGDGGIEFPFIPPITVAVIWGYEFQQQPVPPRSYRSGAFVHELDEGIHSPFINFFPSGWQQVFSQDRHPIWKSPTLGDPLGLDFPQINFFPAGWEQVTSQPLHRPLKSPDVGDTGIEFPFVFVSPTPTLLGFEQVFSQPIHRFYRSPEFGDQGTQFPLIRFFPYGWEVQPPQPPHTWVRHRGAWMRGPDAIENPFSLWLNWGFDQTLSQDKHPRPERAAAFMRGDEGNQFPFIPFLPYGWEIQPFQPPRAFWERRGLWMRGDEGFQFPFLQFFPVGWEQIFSQPRYWPQARLRGAWMRGDEGIQFPFVLPPVIPGITGFEQVSALTRQTLQTRGGAILPWQSPADIFPTPFTPATGNVFVIDTIQSYFLGPQLTAAGFAKGPFVNQPYTMIFVVGPGMITSPVLLTFTRPDGSLTTGVVPRGFIGDARVTQKYIADFPAFQYIVYTFAPGELNQAGVWHVSAIADHFFSQTWPFTVMQYP